MKILKICFVTREYAHDFMGKTGGIGVFLKQFTSQLKEYDFDITVFSFGETAVRFNDAGVHVIKIKDLSAFNERIKAPLRRYRIPGYITIKHFLEFINRLYISLYLSVFVKRHQFDLVEFHDYGGDSPFFIGSLPKVVRCHGTAVTLHQFMGYYYRYMDAYFEKLFFKRFQKHVIAVSEYSANTTVKAFSLKEKPTVIYNGITVPEVEEKLNYLSSPTLPFSIFYFGSVRERKGIDIACKVFNETLLQYPKATFHVMGNNNNDYWNTTAIKQLTKDARAKTTYYGTVPNEDINSYLQKAHVVLFPSFGENFSIALLEVLAIGKLVVTSDIYAFKEIIVHGENGFIVDEYTDYYKYITSIFSKEIDVNKVSERAIHTVKHHFDMDTIIQQNINYYNSLL